MLRNMASSLLHHEKVVTTLSKAKELKPYAERIITLAKRGRHELVRRHVHERPVWRKLFEVLVERYKTRNGGYTRILRLPPRRGDNASRGRIELVS